MRKVKPMRACEFKRIINARTGKTLELFTREGREHPRPLYMPPSIIIRGKHFRVISHSKIYAARRACSKLMGCVFYPERLIFICNELSESQMWETLYHEVAHAYLHDTPLNESLTPVQIEAMCDLFGQSVYDLAQNNKIVASGVP